MGGDGPLMSSPSEARAHQNDRKIKVVWNAPVISDGVMEMNVGARVTAGASSGSESGKKEVYISEW